MSAIGYFTGEVFQQVFNANHHKHIGANKRDINMRGTKWNVAFEFNSENRMEIEVALEESNDKINFPIPVYAEFVFAAIGYPNHEVLRYHGLFYEGQSSGRFQMAPLIVNGFSVRCEVRLHPRRGREFKIPRITVAESKFMKNLSGFLQDEKFSDVSIEVQGREIMAHKVVLSAASSVFSALLDANEDKIEVSDIDYETMLQVVTCIYTGMAPDMENCAENVLVAADKFQLDWLKTECEDVLMKGIDAENSCDIMINGYLYNANQLKEGAQAFIMANFKDVKNTAGFRKLGESHLHLLLEILQCCDLVPEQKVTIDQETDI